MSRPAAITGGLAAAYLGLALLSTLWGTVAIPPRNVARVMTALVGLGDDSSVSPIERFLVRDVRLPQAFLLGLVGAALACSGAALQATFENPLADPAILGVSGGAALGAVIAIHTGLAESVFLSLPVCACVGGFAASLLVYALDLPRWPADRPHAAPDRGCRGQHVHRRRLARDDPDRRSSGPGAAVLVGRRRAEPDLGTRRAGRPTDRRRDRWPAPAPPPPGCDVARGRTGARDRGPGGRDAALGPGPDRPGDRGGHGGERLDRLRGPDGPAPHPAPDRSPAPGSPAGMRGGRGGVPHGLRAARAALSDRFALHLGILTALLGGPTFLVVLRRTRGGRP